MLKPPNKYGNTVTFRRYEPLDGKLIPIDDVRVLPLSEGLKYTDRIARVEPSLREMQLEYNKRKMLNIQDHSDYMDYNFNFIREKKPMFNETEVQFIEETAKRDLAAIKSKIDQFVNEMARLGKNLADIKVVESKLISIVEAIKDSKEDEQNCNKRCC